MRSEKRFLIGAKVSLRGAVKLRKKLRQLARTGNRDTFLLCGFCSVVMESEWLGAYLGFFQLRPRLTVIQHHPITVGIG